MKEKDYDYAKTPPAHEQECYLDPGIIPDKKAIKDFKQSSPEKRIIKAFSEVYDSLEVLAVKDRERVLKAVSIMFGVDHD